MRLPLEWLHQYCDPGLGADALAARLALTGTEVERVHGHGVPALDGFVVGRVETAGPHPDADRLRVCTVEVADGDVRQIVCGAPNVAAGQTVPVGLVGATMPDGTKLKRAKLRGQESNGMILSERELEIGADHDGIMVLPDGIAPGTPLAEVLPIATDVLELEITPNRPDCLAVYGVAREVHAATGAELAPPEWADDPGRSGDVVGVRIDVEDPDLCPRFTARLFEDVEIGPSPPWLKARLMAAGQRPINNVVDITNYVMLATGQPLHAFDFDLVAGGHLIVRRARPGERMTTLDDVERTLDEQMAIICDDAGPTSIAGVMGGRRSEVQPGTTRVLMEAATWNGPNIQRTSTRLALRSEASSRFEKQLQPEQTMDGQALAHRLMVELCGARPVGGTVDVGGVGADPLTIAVPDARVSGLLGADVPRAESARILAALGFGVADAGDGLDVTVPYWRRGDVTRQADVIEEIARLWGLEKLPSTLPSRRGAIGGLEGGQRLRRRAEDALAGAGLLEAVGWSFAAPDLVERLRLPADDPRRAAVTLRNPMSEDQSVLRTTLLGSLLDALRRNRARGAADVRLFEYGGVYLAQPRGGDRTAVEERSEPLPEERRHLAALLTGALRPPTWREERPPAADFFSAKAVLAALLGALRVEWTVERADEPFLHPGRSARVLVAGEPAGWLGELHPAVAAGWDLETAAGFELRWSALEQAAVTVPRYEDVTSFPAVHRDLALSIPEDVPAGDVVASIAEAGGPRLRSVEVFDVYHGPQAGEGRKSVGLRLEIGASDRTLTDDEVQPVVAKILRVVLERHGAAYRD
jgi:phenylalanyl-tRNA synthetase beta chain